MTKEKETAARSETAPINAEGQDSTAPKRQPGELASAPPSATEESFVLPRSMVEEIQRTLEFYASDEFYSGPRTGGVVEGCPRGAPLNDGGDQALATLVKLTRLYPLPRAQPSATEPTSIQLQQGAVYMIDGRAHKMCTCNNLDQNCPRGRKRQLQTAGYDCCMVPTPDVVLVFDK